MLQSLPKVRTEEEDVLHKDGGQTVYVYCLLYNVRFHSHSFEHSAVSEQGQHSLPACSCVFHCHLYTSVILHIDNNYTTDCVYMMSVMLIIPDHRAIFQLGSTNGFFYYCAMYTLLKLAQVCHKTQALAFRCVGLRGSKFQRERVR